MYQCVILLYYVTLFFLLIIELGVNTLYLLKRNRTELQFKNSNRCNQDFQPLQPRMQTVATKNSNRCNQDFQPLQPRMQTVATKNSNRCNQDFQPLQPRFPMNPTLGGCITSTIGTIYPLIKVRTLRMYVSKLSCSMSSCLRLDRHSVSQENHIMLTIILSIGGTKV